MSNIGKAEQENPNHEGKEGKEEKKEEGGDFACVKKAQAETRKGEIPTSKRLRSVSSAWPKYP